jgi:hypothetical protein
VRRNPEEMAGGHQKKPKKEKKEKKGRLISFSVTGISTQRGEHPI